MAVVDRGPKVIPSPDPVSIFYNVLKLGPLSGKGRGPSFEQRFPASPEFNDPIALGRQIQKGQARLEQATAPTVRGFRGRMVSQADISPVVRLEVAGLNKSLATARARLGVLESRSNAPILNTGPVYASVGIPAATGAIFKGTTAGRAARVIGGMAKAPKAGGIIGPLVVGGILAGQELIRVIEEQKSDENKAFDKKTAAEDKQINRRVDQIRKELAEEARQEAKREREFRAAEAEKEREFKRNQAKAAKTDRERERKAKRAAAAIIKQIKEDAKAFEKQEKARIKAEKERKTRVIKLLGAAFGAVKSAKALKDSKRAANRGFGFQAPPVFNFSQAPSAVTPLLAESRATARTATKSRVETCRSDTPKRKPGKCRTGFFRETPNRTIYKTWSEKSCL